MKAEPNTMLKSLMKLRDSPVYVNAVQMRQNVLKKAEYMSYHLGEEFEGIISGVTGWGLYVELPNTVEGLVHVNTLRDDYYIFDQETYELRGEMTKKVYKLGDKVCVRVADADKMLKTVDFELVADIWNDEEEN